MLGTRNASSRSGLPWIIFFVGCLCPVLAYFLDSPGVWVFISLGLLIVGFSACVSAPWARSSDDPTTKALLSFGAAAVYFGILLALLCVSFAVDGLPQD
jgi:asparagine N-glycosylation enzyme membrane subunit Stt3